MNDVPAAPLTNREKLEQWAGAILAKIGAGANSSPQAEASASALAKVIETGGAMRYRSAVPQRGRRGSPLALHQPFELVRVHAKFPFNPMFCTRGMDRRTFHAMLRGHKRATGTPMPYGRFAPAEIETLLERLVLEWFKAKLESKTGWLTAPELRRGTHQEWAGFMRKAAAKQKAKAEQP
jgi:hypothetical protein